MAEELTESEWDQIIQTMRENDTESHDHAYYKRIATLIFVASEALFSIAKARNVVATDADEQGNDGRNHG